MRSFSLVRNTRRFDSRAGLPKSSRRSKNCAASIYCTRTSTIPSLRSGAPKQRCPDKMNKEQRKGISADLNLLRLFREVEIVLRILGPCLITLGTGPDLWTFWPFSLPRGR